MKKLILLGIMLAGIVLFGLSRVLAATETPNNEVTANTRIPLAGATIMITMRAVAMSSYLKVMKTRLRKKEVSTK